MSNIESEILQKISKSIRSNDVVVVKKYFDANNAMVLAKAIISTHKWELRRYASTYTFSNQNKKTAEYIENILIDNGFSSKMINVNAIERQLCLIGIFGMWTFFLGYTIFSIILYMMYDYYFNFDLANSVFDFFLIILYVVLTVVTLIGHVDYKIRYYRIGGGLDRENI